MIDKQYPHSNTTPHHQEGGLHSNKTECLYQGNNKCVRRSLPPTQHEDEGKMLE